MPEYIIANTAEDYKAATMLFTEYAGSLDIDLGFQHFEDELNEPDEMYSTPSGCIILCKNDCKFTGCVAIRKINNETAELKRMYVQPVWQGKGVGKVLLDKAIQFAKAANYCCVRLDTLTHMFPAINLYRQYGFYEIPAYYHNPNKTTVYFEIKC